MVWNCYEEHLKFAQTLNDPRIEFISGNDSNAYSRLLSMVIGAFQQMIYLFLDQKCISRSNSYPKRDY